MLLLAVWLPLDNALAGAVVQGCPMMSHAFERGFENTFKPEVQKAEKDLHAAHCCASMSGASSGAPSEPVLYHCVNGCEHCSLCLLLGGVALPPNPFNASVQPALPQKIQSPLPASNPSVVATLFRPPII